MTQYALLTDPPEGVVLESAVLPASSSSPALASDPSSSIPANSPDAIPILVDDDDVPFDPDYQAYLGAVRRFEAAHDFSGLPIITELPPEPRPESRPPPPPEAPLPDLATLFAPPDPQILLKHDLDLIFLEDDFPEKVLLPPKFVDRNIPTLPGSPHEPVLPKDAMFPTNRMIVNGRKPEMKIDRSASEEMQLAPQGMAVPGRPRSAPPRHDV
jgi:hypothetical protein